MPQANFDRTETADFHPIWSGDFRLPDVWWGESGIDADIWSDPIPYVESLANASAEAAAPLLAGDPR